MTERVEPGRMQQLRLQKFHTLCISLCASRKTFKGAFEIDRHHVAARATQTASHLRWSLMNEEALACVIKHGILNEPFSNDQNPIEIAIEGRFKDFQWVDPSQITGKMEGIEPTLCVRVVVRERKPKHLVVTVYVLPEDLALTEVPNEIWN